MSSKAAIGGKTNVPSPKRPRSRRPTILDVARLAQVGAGTVSRVINKHPSVTAEVRQSVESAIAQLGYEPDVLARSMRRTRTREVGCIFRNAGLARVAPLLDGISSVITEAGSNMVLGLAEDCDAALTQLRSFGQHRIDGVVLALSDEPGADIVRTLEQFGLRAVFVNNAAPAARPSVVIDYRGGVVQAIRCLIGFGHRRIAMLSTNTHRYTMESFVAGYREGHQLGGLHVDETLIRIVGRESEMGARETKSLLAGDTPPTAILVSGDHLLSGVARAVQSSGRVIGRDVSIVTMGDSDLAELLNPAIPAIRWDVREVGRVAARLLLDGLENPASVAPELVVIPAELVLRGSCQPAP